MTNALLRLEDGRHVPLSAVQELRPGRRNERGVALVDVIGVDGQKLGQTFDRYVDVAAGTVIPASPGWRVGLYFAGDDDNDLGTVFMPIIAWRIESTGYVMPITIKGDADYRQPWIIVGPDGHVFEPDLGMQWDTLEQATTPDLVEELVLRAAPEAVA